LVYQLGCFESSKNWLNSYEYRCRADFMGTKKLPFFALASVLVIFTVSVARSESFPEFRPVSPS
jgi:hypothetical protein